MSDRLLESGSRRLLEDSSGLLLEGDVTAPGNVGYVDVWTGSGWLTVPAKVWTGSTWKQAVAKVWTGSAWKLVHENG